MRIMVKVTGPEGQSNEGYRDLTSNPVADALEMVLATKGLVKLVEHFDTGVVVEYGQLEYGCEWCSSYDHASDDCPELEADDDIEEPYPGS